MSPTNGELADLLADGAGWLAERGALTVAALDWEDASEVTRALVDMAGWDVLANPAMAHVMVGALAHALDRQEEWSPAGVAPAVDRLLLGTPTSAAGLIALWVVTQAGGRSGWAPEWRERLRRLRVHPEASVRLSSTRVVTAAE